MRPGSRASMTWGSDLANGSEEAGAVSGAASRLTREDWIDAAWDALSLGSLDTIKVDRLSKQLNVTRGSFYWHFKKREDLIDAVVDKWLLRLGMSNAVRHLFAADKPAAERLWDVFEYVIRAVTGPQSVFLRIASADNERIRRRMHEEDFSRIEGYKRLFVEIGLSDAGAQEFAETYYIIVMSEFLRNGRAPMAERLEQARRKHAFVVDMAEVKAAEGLRKA